MSDLIEDCLKENLSAEEYIISLKLIAFCKGNGLEFVKDNAYWKDKNYFYVKNKENCVLYISIKDPDEPENRWTIWTDDIGDDLLNRLVVDDTLKEIAWQRIDHCGSCGSCGGGRHKIFFGNEFNDVCGCTFRFDNPNADDLMLIEKVIKMQICDMK